MDTAGANGSQGTIIRAGQGDRLTPASGLGRFLARAGTVAESIPSRFPLFFVGLATRLVRLIVIALQGDCLALWLERTGAWLISSPERPGPLARELAHPKGPLMFGWFQISYSVRANADADVLIGSYGDRAYSEARRREREAEIPTISKYWKLSRLPLPA